MKKKTVYYLTTFIFIEDSEDSSTSTSMIFCYECRNRKSFEHEIVFKVLKIFFENKSSLKILRFVNFFNSNAL